LLCTGNAAEYGSSAWTTASEAMASDLLILGINAYHADAAACGSDACRCNARCCSDVAADDTARCVE